MHGEADARESGRLEWTLNDDDDDDDDDDSSFLQLTRTRSFKKSAKQLFQLTCI